MAWLQQALANVAVRNTIDIVLNITILLVLLFAGATFVFQTGKFFKGVLLISASLVGYELLSLLCPIFLRVGPSYEESFEEGRGLFVMLAFAGWVYGIIVSLMALGARWIFSRRA